MTMCEQSQPNDSGQMELLGLTSFVAASPVNRFPLPGSSKARTITATSGRKCSGLYRKQSPLGLLVKMLLVSSVWHSTKCGLIWKTKVTKSNRLLFQLVPSMPTTEGTEYGLLPTPQANKTTESGEIVNSDGTPWNGVNKPHSATTNKPITTALADAVRRFYPTPHASCGTGAGAHGLGGPPNLQTVVRMLPTPSVSMVTMADMVQAQFAGNDPKRPTYAQAKLMATPTAQDAKNSTLPPSQLDRDSVPVNLLQQGQTGQLSPLFVEWLMGYPEGWTDLNVSETQ